MRRLRAPCIAILNGAAGRPVVWVPLAPDFSGTLAGHEVAFGTNGERPDGDPFGLRWESVVVGRSIGLERAPKTSGLASGRALHTRVDDPRSGGTSDCACRVSRHAPWHASAAPKPQEPETALLAQVRWPCLVNYYPRRCGGWSPNHDGSGVSPPVGSSPLAPIQSARPIQPICSGRSRSWIHAAWARQRIGAGPAGGTAADRSDDGNSCSLAAWIR